jgi:hypothetical protein
MKNFDETMRRIFSFGSTKNEHVSAHPYIVYMLAQQQCTSALWELTDETHFVSEELGSSREHIVLQYSSGLESSMEDFNAGDYIRRRRGQHCFDPLELLA